MKNLIKGLTLRNYIKAHLIKKYRRWTMKNKREIQLIADEAVKIAIENPRLSLVEAVRLAEKTFKKEKEPISRPAK